jgi:phosphoribosylamine--glycine ligase
VRVLVVGSGAREHAIAWKLATEDPRTEVICAPGNAGIAHVAECVPVNPADPGAILDTARRESAELTVIGPEAPLERGVADRFAAEGLSLFGPTRRAARLETSKAFAKDFLRRQGIRTARYRLCGSPDEARGLIETGELGWPLVVKADGLAAGKGVVIAADRVEAAAAVDTLMVERRFGAAGDRTVLEEHLAGREASLFAICDGTRAVLLATAEDHKRALDDDRGPNTGGMGAFAPSVVVDESIRDRILVDIVRPTLAGMRAEGAEFRGFLYVGLMITPRGPHVVEFNARLGDPEAQVVLPALAEPLAPLLQAAAAGRLSERTACRASAGVQVGVVLASAGYPGAYETGKPIEGLGQAEQVPGVLVFHAGTRRVGSRILTDGGRVLTVVARGPDYADAIDRAYRAVDEIRFEGRQYRRDIGRRAASACV